MLDEDDNSVLIDFDCIQKEGQEKTVMGIPGWFRNSSVANRGDDYFTVGLLAKYLDTGERVDDMDEYPVSRRMCGVSSCTNFKQSDAPISCRK